MKINPFLCIVFLVASFSLKADQVVVYPKDKSVFTFTLPDKWETEHDENGLLSTPPDDDSVILEVTELEAPVGELEAAIKEAKETMSDFKNVKYDEAQKAVKDGLSLTVINGTGEDEHGKATINLVVITKEGSKNYILLSCISSKEGIKNHSEAISAMLQSIKAK